MTPFDHICFAGKSDIGRKRKNNEDSFGMFPSLGVWLVADGMGGGDDGEVASAAVVREVDAFVSACPAAASGAYAADDVLRGVETAVGKASAWIFRRTREKRLATCGSTVVGCVVDPVKPGRVVAFHAGDSRLYRLRGRGIKQITVDHSAAELIGVKDEAKVNPMFRGMVLRAVGVKASVEVELTEFEVKEGDRVLICSDGLSRMVPDRKIASVSRGERDPEKAVGALIAAANDAGGVDNVTAVLIEFGKLPEPAVAATLPVAEGCDRAAATDAETSETGDGTELTRMTSGVVEPENAVGEVEAHDAPSRSFLRCRWRWAALVGAVSASVLALLALAFRHSGRETPPRAVPVSAKPAVVAPTNCQVTVVTTNAPTAASSPDEPAPQPVALTATSSDQFEPFAEKDVPAMTNGPALRQDMPAPVVTNVAAKARVESLQPPEGCEELAALCKRETLSLLAELVRRRLSPERALEFGEQMKRAQSSAQAVHRLKSAKASSRFLIDLKYALQSAPEVREVIAARSDLAQAWDFVKDGDGESVSVRLAAVKVLKELEEALR